MKIIADIKAAYSKFLGWLGLNKRQDIESREEIKKTRQRRRKNDWETHVDGDYSSAKDLLNDLDDRHEFLKAFKPYTSETGLRLVKRLGVYMTQTNCYRPDSAWCVNRLDGGKDRPYPMAFAHCSQDTSDNPDIVTSRECLSWAEKMKWSHKTFYVEKPSNGWLYMFGMVFRYDKKTFYRIEIPIEIDTETGEARILKSYKTSEVKLPTGTCYTKKAWEIPTFGVVSYQDEVEGKVSKDAMREYALVNFVMTYNRYLRREASTQIHATKNGQRMIFTVPMHTWKDFFKDRITAIASDGKKKRIFHHVSAHIRANGQSVPMHTRGVTRFKWNGFNIKICELKKGRVSSTDLDAAGECLTDEEYYENLRSGTKYISADELGRRVTQIATEDLHKPTVTH